MSGQQQQAPMGGGQARPASGTMTPGGLSLPNRPIQHQQIQQLQQQAGPSTPAIKREATPSGQAPTPTATATATTATTTGKGASNTDDKSTNVDALMDAVGASGVDISQEEERMRQANEQRRMLLQQSQSSVAIDRTRRQDFIDPSLLAEVVKKVAAAFQLRTLEPDTIPFIALATRHRLLSLITAAVKARNHRLNASHLHPPPFVNAPKAAKRKWNEMAVDDDERARASDDDDDEDSSRDSSDEDDEGEGGERRRKEKVPAWDVLIRDDPEKLLAALERVDREEERRNRRERVLRDEKEQEEQQRRDAAATESTADPSAIPSKTDAVNRLVVGAAPSTPSDATASKSKKKRRKDMTETAQHKNMSEDVKKRLTDQVAMQSLGVKRFSWMNAGGGAPGSGFSTPTPKSKNAALAGLPAPKFSTPLSDLPPPTFTPQGGLATPGTGSGQGTPAPVDGLSTAIPGMSLLEKMDVPAIHVASAADPHRVELTDALYAMERERGMGVGKGSGRNVLVRARTGVTLNRHKLALQQQQQRQFDGTAPPPPPTASTGGAGATATTGTGQAASQPASGQPTPSGTPRP